MKPKMWMAAAVAAVVAMGAAPAFAMDGIGHGGSGGGGSVTGGSADPFASVGAIIADAGRFVRDAVSRRAGDGQTDGLALWASGFSDSDTRDATAASSTASNSTTGAMAGFDLPVGGWRWGGAATVSDGDFRVGAEDADGRLKGRGAMLYGAGPVGPMRLRLGAAWTRTDVDLRRTDATGAYAAGSKADTTQGFAELAWQIEAGGLTLEPFAGVSVTKMELDGFAEAGGPSPFLVDGQSRTVTQTDLGARVSWTAGPFMPFADLGWRRSSGDLDPLVAIAGGASGGGGSGGGGGGPAGKALTWGVGGVIIGGGSGGGTPSTGSVRGAPIARDAATVRAGAAWSFAPNASLRVQYDAVLSSEGREQAVQATLAWRF